MKEYEINNETLAIIPKSKNKSIVYEKDNNYVVEESTEKIMEDSCVYFGSSLKGRQDGSKKILNTNHKVPIVIEETSKIIFFPTASPRLEKCSWINLNNIVKYEKHDKGCKITFKDKKVVILPISYGMINNQILRASRLQYILNERKASKNQKNAKKSEKNGNFVL